MLNPVSKSTDLVDLMPMHRTAKETVAEHTKSHERQCHMLREEDLANRCRNICKGVSDTTNDKILKQRGALNEGGLFGRRREVALKDQLQWHS
jgi:hypothetical protein